MILTHWLELINTGNTTIQQFYKHFETDKCRFPTPNTPKTMNRTKLLHSFEQSATANGYAFHSTDERYIPQLVHTYPALWLTPPLFQSMVGRTHGTITYTVTAHALDAGAKLSPSERNTRQAALEQDLLGLFASLSEEDYVIAVENLKIKHSSQTLSAAGEVAATATAEVITFF
jgi:hypothetical protein